MLLLKFSEKVTAINVKGKTWFCHDLYHYFHPAGKMPALIVNECPLIDVWQHTVGIHNMFICSVVQQMCIHVMHTIKKNQKDLLCLQLWNSEWCSVLWKRWADPRAQPCDVPPFSKHCSDVLYGTIIVHQISAFPLVACLSAPDLSNLNQNQPGKHAQ